MVGLLSAEEQARAPCNMSWICCPWPRGMAEKLGRHLRRVKIWGFPSGLLEDGQIPAQLVVCDVSPIVVPLNTLVLNEGTKYVVA